MSDRNILNRISKIHLDTCPFCGGHGRVECFGISEFVIECQGCWCRTQVEDTPEEAAENGIGVMIKRMCKYSEIEKQRV